MSKPIACGVDAALVAEFDVDGRRFVGVADFLDVASVGESCDGRTYGVGLLLYCCTANEEVLEGAVCLDVIVSVDGIEVDESRQVGIVDVERNGERELEGAGFHRVGA